MVHAQSSLLLSPTNLWSANASAARQGLGLGSAATNPSTAFQPASSALTNLVNGNGGSLTNLRATNIVGTIPASNIPIVNLTNINGTLTVSSGGTGATNAADARVSLGLGTAATNPVTAFQPSSASLTNLATGNGAGLTNLQATNIVGVIPASNIATVNFSNVGGTLSVTAGGTGATNAAGARTNLGVTTVGEALFTAATASSARSAIAAVGIGDVIAISNGGSGATTAGGARTNLGLGAANDVTFQNITISDQTLTLSHGPEDDVFVRNDSGNLEFGTEVNGVYFKVHNSTLSTRFEVPIEFNNPTNSATTRTNLGLGLSVLTNTTATAFRSALLPSYSNNAAKILALNSNATDVEWITPPVSGGVISNIAISNVTGLQTELDAKLSTNPAQLTVGAGSTTNMAVQIGTNATTGIWATTGPNLLRFRNGSASMELATNGALTVSSVSAGTLNVYSGGSITFSVGANIAVTRTNLGLGLPALTNTTVGGLRNALGLGSSNDVTFNTITLDASTNSAIVFSGGAAERTRQNLSALATNGNGAGLTNLTAANITGTVALASNVSGTIAISNGGSGATTAGGARTNLGLGATNSVVFGEVAAIGGLFGEPNDLVVDTQNYGLYASGSFVAGWDFNMWTFNTPFNFVGVDAALNKAVSRTNLGLLWTGLTNSNASTFRTALGLATTSSVVFGGIAATNTTGDIAASFSGQVTGHALEIVTADEDLATGYGSSNFAIGVGYGRGVMIKYGADISDWGTPVLTDQFGNIAHPGNVKIYKTRLLDFTNVSSSGSSSGGATYNKVWVYSMSPNSSGITNTFSLDTNDVVNGYEVKVTHTGLTSSVTAVKVSGAATNLITLNRTGETVDFIYRGNQWTLANNPAFVTPLLFAGANASVNAASSRTNLGLGGTNDVQFKSVVASNSGASATLTVDGGLIFAGSSASNAQGATRTNLGLLWTGLTNTNAATFQGALFAATNTAPATTTNVAAWINLQVGTNTYKLPLYQ
jgi:fibronectin-binding autotransporter adhesin